MNGTWQLAANTLLLAAGAAGISVPLGTLSAILMFRTNVPGRRFGMVALGAMLFVPLYLHAAGWDAGFGRLGWHSLESGSVAYPLLDGWRAAIWIHGVAAIPWTTLIVAIGVSLTEPELEEAALLDAAAGRVFLAITLRRAAASAGVAALWVLVWTAGEITVTDMYRVQTLAEVLFLDVPYVDELSEAGLAAAPLAMILALLAGVSLLLLYGLSPRERIETDRPPLVFRLGWARYLASLALALLLLLVAGVPLGNLVYKAGFVARPTADGYVMGWEAGKLGEVLAESPGKYAEEFGWTLAVAGTAATLAILLAGPPAWLARRGRLWALPALLSAAICLAIPGPLVGLGLIEVFNPSWQGAPEPLLDALHWLYNKSILVPALAAAVRAFPVVLLVLWHAWRTLANAPLEAARLEGAGAWRRLLRIAAPQRISALAGAWLIAAAIAMGDLAATSLVLPAGVDTVSRRIFGLIHAGVDDQVAGIALISAAGFAALGAATFALLFFRQRRQNRRRAGSR